eukprot:239593-Pleurochrysis_carterae.AAC.2
MHEGRKRFQHLCMAARDLAGGGGGAIDAYASARSAALASARGRSAPISEHKSDESLDAAAREIAPPRRAARDAPRRLTEFVQGAQSRSG